MHSHQQESSVDAFKGEKRWYVLTSGSPRAHYRPIPLLPHPCFLETEPGYAVYANLALSIYLRVASNSAQPSCLSLPVLESQACTAMPGSCPTLTREYTWSKCHCDSSMYNHLHSTRQRYLNCNCSAEPSNEITLLRICKLFLHELSHLFLWIIQGWHHLLTPIPQF